MKNQLKIIQTWIDGEYDKAINSLKEQPVIVQYYLVKGLKLANQKTFYAAFNTGTRGNVQNRMDFIKNILVEVYDYKTGPKDNYNTAYKGMGNIDAYATAIKAL